MAILTPPSLYQQHMPKDVQELLSAFGVTLPAFDIMVDDDGVPTSGAEAVAEYVAYQCFESKRTVPTLELVIVVARVAAHFARRERRP